MSLNASITSINSSVVVVSAKSNENSQTQIVEPHQNFKKLAKFQQGPRLTRFHKNQQPKKSKDSKENSIACLVPSDASSVTDYNENNKENQSNQDDQNANQKLEQVNRIEARILSLKSNSQTNPVFDRGINVYNKAAEKETEKEKSRSEKINSFKMPRKITASEIQSQPREVYQKDIINTSNNKKKPSAKSKDCGIKTTCRDLENNSILYEDDLIVVMESDEVKSQATNHEEETDTNHRGEPTTESRVDSQSSQNQQLSQCKLHKNKQMVKNRLKRREDFLNSINGNKEIYDPLSKLSYSTDRRTSYWNDSNRSSGNYLYSPDSRNSRRSNYRASRYSSTSESESRSRETSPSSRTRYSSHYSETSYPRSSQDNNCPPPAPYYQPLPYNYYGTTYYQQNYKSNNNQLFSPQSTTKNSSTSYPTNLDKDFDKMMLEEPSTEIGTFHRGQYLSNEDQDLIEFRGWNSDENENDNDDLMEPLFLINPESNQKSRDNNILVSPQKDTNLFHSPLSALSKNTNPTDSQFNCSTCKTDLKETKLMLAAAEIKIRDLCKDVELLQAQKNVLELKLDAKCKEIEILDRKAQW